MGKKKAKTVQAPHHSVYVIELPIDVAEDKKFLKMNPDYVPGSTCLYVGMTSLPIEKRFEQHATGHKKAARPCKKYGVKELRDDLMTGYAHMPYSDACEKEVSDLPHLTGPVS